MSWRSDYPRRALPRGPQDCEIWRHLLAEGEPATLFIPVRDRAGRKTYRCVPTLQWEAEQERAVMESFDRLLDRFLLGELFATVDAHYEQPFDSGPRRVFYLGPSTEETC